MSGLPTRRAEGRGAGNRKGSVGATLFRTGKELCRGQKAARGDGALWLLSDVEANHVPGQTESFGTAEAAEDRNAYRREASSKRPNGVLMGGVYLVDVDTQRA